MLNWRKWLANFFETPHNASFFSAGVAQLVEHLTCNQGVASSIPAAGTKSQTGYLFQVACFTYCHAYALQTQCLPVGAAICPRRRYIQPIYRHCPTATSVHPLIRLRPGAECGYVDNHISRQRLHRGQRLGRRFEHPLFRFGTNRFGRKVVGHH